MSELVGEPIGTAASPRPRNEAEPKRNRVTPLGDIVAIALRGAWTGNRGILHRDGQIVRFHASDLWITCARHYQDRWHEQWQPHHFTWLYFHDEAVSLAAGHRPCAECRCSAYNAYRDAWSTAVDGSCPPLAREINRQLHAERLVRGTHRRRLHPTPWSDLPDGTFVQYRKGSAIVIGSRIVEWTHSGYTAAAPRPVRGEADVITPPSSVAVLRAGYPVQIDAAALGD